MDILASLIDSLLEHRAHFTDRETPAERQARMTVIGVAIDRATKRAACIDQPLPCKPIFSDRRLLTALLVVKGEFETGFAEKVHSGRCSEMPKGMRCDADRSGVARAHGPWQQWKSSVFPSEDWDLMNASTQEATDIAAWHAAKLLSGGTKRCAYLYPDPMASTIAAFSGSCIRMTPGMVNRQAKAVYGVLARLHDAKPES